MFDADRINEVLQTLSKNKLRTTLTAFGVFWGIFMLIIMLGSGHGLQNGVTRSFGGSATNAVYMWTQQTTIPYKGLPRNRSFNFLEDDIKAIKDNVPELDVLAPSAQLGGYRGENNVSRGTKTGPFVVRGDFPDNRFIQIFKMTSGRYLNELDIKEKRKVCVIAQRVLEVLFAKDENPLGQYIQVNGTYFRVIGTLTSEKSGDDAEEKMQTIYIPFTTFQQAFNWGGRIGWFSLTAKPQYEASMVEDKVKKILAQRHKISPNDPYAIGSWNSEKEFSKIQGLFSGISMLVWVVGIGTLLAGVIGVSNIMLIIVKERTREIGVRRALGATPASIIAQIVSESVLLTSLAGYFGLIAGVFLLEGISKAIEGQDTGMFYQPGVELIVVLKALGILIVCGALAGIIPARKAIAISPVDALRYE
ncbi:MAG: multidrug ABC transporter ATP-binding protein [Bacteroidetes bacterium B1(2017)]|nr:MAG: multidrug ABC transporter ATP-binding protein [Bacteroidetes bacterium B1(2017)]